MIQNYFPNLPKQELSIQDELWDSYLDKQLSHLVLEFSFDFERIAQALKSIKYKQSETAIDREKCQNRWYFLHNKRKNEQSNPIIIEETNEQKFNKLMSRVSPPETFDIFEQKIDETNIPSDFNIFKDSIRGFKEKELAKQKEKNFLKNLDNILLDDEESKIDKPLLFKVEFLDDKSICFTKEILSKEKADEILSKKIDWSKLSKEDTTSDNLDFSRNLVPLEENKNDDFQLKEKVETALRKNEEIPAENKFNELILKEQNEFKEEDEIQKKFRKIEEGFFTIEDVVQDLNKLNQELVSPNRDQHIENKIIQLSTNITTTMRTETSTIDNSQSRNSNDISSLKQILIMKEIENVVERPKEKEEISSKFIGINENSSLESSSEDDDYLEQQRLHLKLGSNVLFPETCSKEKKKKKRRTKPLEEKKDKGNQNELPIIEKMMQEKIKNKKMQETDEKNALNQFEAGEKFKKQLILEEIERKKNAEREKDLEEMKRLQEKFKSEIEENKKKKKEKRQKDVEDQAIHIAEQKKIIEQQSKDLEIKRLKSLELYHKEEEASKKDKQITNEMNELLKKIQNYNTNSSIGFLFDENFAQMSHVGCLPEDVYYSFKDSKEYELSRHGITKRYQILIFPYLDDELFIAEFLAYFLKNSYMSSETLSKKEKDYFSFHLLGMHISAFTPVFADKDEEMFCYSSYLDNSYELMRQIETNNIRRCIYMLFDTYLGEGSHILGDVVLDEKIYNNVLSELCIKKLKKKQIFDFNEKTTLKNFAIKHLKSMKIAIKLFKEVSTFHPISLKTNKIRSEIMKNHEVGLIFMKRFLKDKLFSDKTNKDITNENILKYLLERTTIKGLDLIGMKTIYFDQDSFREFSQNFEKSKFFEMNIPFLVIAFAGCDAVAKLEKIVGSNDLFLARKLNATSINALFYDKREETIHYFLNKQMNKKLLNYFFGGRLFNFTKQNFEKILFDPKKEKKFHLFPEIIEYYPLFQVIVQPTQSHLVILSPIFRDLSQIIKLFEKYGFVIQIIRTLSAESFAKITKEDEKISTELSIFIDEEKLNKFCFSYEEENKFSNCIFMIVDGPNLNFLKKKLLKKVIIHNKDFYPSRKHLFYESTKKEIVLLWQNFLGHSIKIQHPNFTKCSSVSHYLAFWPVNETQGDLLHVAKDLELLKAHNFELIAINFVFLKDLTQENPNRQQIITILKEEINKNLNFSNFMKKKIEYHRFLENFVSFILQSKKVICAFRFQGSNDDLNSKQIFENKMFANSIQKCPDNLIYTITNKKNKESDLDYRNHIFHQNFDTIFLKMDLEKLLILSHEMNLELSDDTSILNSVIHDFNTKSLRPVDSDFRKALLIINDDTLKTLSLYGLLKRLENEELHIEFISKRNMKQYQDVVDLFWKNIKNFINCSFKKNLKDTNIVKNEREKNEILMKFLDSMNHNISWVLILSSDNAVHKCKNLANFFVKTLQILRNQRPEDEEKIDFLSQKKLQLNYGIYCPLNFDNNIEEIGLIEKYLFANSSIIHSKNADEIQNKPNIISFLIKINTKDSSKEMNHFLQNLYQSQVKIIDIVISNNEAFKNNIYDCLNLFNQSLNQTQFNIFWKNNSEGLVCVLLADCSEVLSINELFGSFKFDSFGQIIRMEKGKLITIDDSNFLIYVEKKEKIQSIREKILIWE